MRYSLRIGTLLALVGFATPATPAQETYNFDPPNFTLGATTPLSNVPPNIGMLGLLTSFSSAPTANGFTIGNTPLNPLFSGQMLYDPVMPADSLTLNFNQPILSISIDFGVQVPSTFRLTDGLFMVDQPSSFIGPNFDFQGGTLFYSNPAGFNNITLSAFSSGMVPVLFGIDNVQVTPVPEPTTVLTIALLSYGAGAYIRRKRRLPRPHSDQ
jgi:hypothetical protein